MTGELNVAVAGFAPSSGASRFEARSMSESVFRTIRESLALSTSTHRQALDIQVGGPQQVGSIDETSSVARQRTAARLDSQLKADLLIYGVVKTSPDEVQIMPEFYFNPRWVRHPEDREPLLTAVTLPYDPSGTASLGTLRTYGYVGPEELARLRTELVERARAFALFILGLDAYRGAVAQRGRAAAAGAGFARAEGRFRAAQATRAWDPRVAHVLYLFLGNAALKQHHWDRAERYYASALTFSPHYLRAQFGLAETRYQRSRGECNPETTDVKGLLRARDSYSVVLRALGPEPGSQRARVQFSLGRAALCLGGAGHVADLNAADGQFRAVVSDYTRGTQGITAQAANAYAGLGLVVLFRENRTGEELRAAAGNFQRSISLMPPSPLQGAVYSFLGFTFAELGDRMAAANAYQDAIERDPDPAQKRAYEEERDDKLRRQKKG